MIRKELKKCWHLEEKDTVLSQHLPLSAFNANCGIEIHPIFNPQMLSKVVAPPPIYTRWRGHLAWCSPLPFQAELPPKTTLLKTSERVILPPDATTTKHAQIMAAPPPATELPIREGEGEKKTAATEQEINPWDVQAGQDEQGNTLQFDYVAISKYVVSPPPQLELLADTI